MLGDTFPVIDKLAKSFVRFVQRCLSDDRHTVTFLVNYGVHVGSIFSLSGQNVAFCYSRFGVLD